MTRWLALVLLATPALADDLPFDPAIVEACFGSAPSADCIGRAAAACTAETGSNVGYARCNTAEWEVWDAELNRSYRALIDLTRAEDAELKDLGSALPPTEPTLRAAQRAWVAWRDAQCAYTRSTFGGGTGGGPAEAECRMRLTAEQALRLDAELAGQGG
ncbi:lysozyme inhibitor LprI family protein [Jannaschia marina]|uniref:lysozyme inhibitor LprI family protein n=1 Tax=Jannaschia marina TaxID=2741674 RepID=UPI0015C9B6F8|nr:lysozyme inhibitor LprI family protein [Jannaschia marina]